MQKKYISIITVALLYAHAIVPVEKVTTKQQYDAAVKKAHEQGKSVAIKFSAVWCGFCKQIQHLFSDLEKEVSEVLYIEVDEKDPVYKDLKKEHGVKAFPTTVVMNTQTGDKKVIRGAKESEIRAEVKKAAPKKKVAKPAPKPQAPTKKTEPASAPKPTIQKTEPAPAPTPTPIKTTGETARVKHPTTKVAYEKIVKQAEDEEKAVAVKFTTSWCTWCKEIADLFYQLEAEVKNAFFVELDGDNKEFAEEKKKHGVTGYPTTVIMNPKKGTKEVVKGAAEPVIRQAVKNAAAGKKPMPQKMVTISADQPEPPAPKTVTQKSKAAAPEPTMVEQPQPKMSKQEKRAARVEARKAEKAAKKAMKGK